MSVKDAVHSKEEKHSLKEEKREWSPAVDEIMSKINAGIQRTKVENAREQRNKSKGKDWDICWDFQSKTGCRKGAHCKWKHVLSPVSAVPFVPQVSYSNKESGYFQGSIRHHQKVDTHYVNPYAPIVPEGLATQSTNGDLDAVARNFKPNVEAKEFWPKCKVNSASSLSKYYQDLTNDLSHKIEDNQMQTKDNQVQVAQGEGHGVQKDTAATKFQDATVDLKTRSSNVIGADSTAEKTSPARHIPNFSNSDLKDITRTITAAGKIVGAKKNENGHAGKASERNEKVQGKSSTPKQPLTFVVNKPTKRTPSRAALSHWADAMSPLMTPHFQNLPMPPLDSVIPLLSSKRGAFSPQQKYIRKSDSPPPLLAKMLKRSESLARLRKKLGMEELGEIGLKRTSSFPNVLAGANGRNSAMSFTGQTEKKLAMHDTEHNRRLLMDRAFIKSQYLRLVETGKFMRGDPSENSQAGGSTVDSGSKRDGRTSKMSPLLTGTSLNHPSECLREIAPLPTTEPSTTQETTRSSRKNVDHNLISQSLEILDGNERTRNNDVHVRNSTQSDSFSPPFKTPEVKPIPRRYDFAGSGYQSKLKSSMRGFSSKTPSFAGSRGRGEKGTSRFPKRWETMGSRRGLTKRGLKGRRFFRGGRPHIGEQQVAKGFVNSAE